jgi:S-adenosylmethionine:tRNA ribosyltransferase-isomerase
MKLSDFDYVLPPELIAQSPAVPRDKARLLVVAKNAKKLEHKIFSDIIDYLQPGDLLVVNNSKVIPARLIGKKQSGGKVEILLSHEIKKSLWEVIGKNIPKIGEKIIFGSNFFAIVKKIEHGTAELDFNCSGNIFFSRLDRFGLMPLPPYIKSSGKKLDSERYQTVYADKHDHGSVAAPTAGLHFTPRLLKELKKKKVKIAYVTLHVGLGTFRPIKTEKITEHVMHQEWISVSQKTLNEIKKTKKSKHKVIAVGTTSVRALESAWENAKGKAWSGWTDIYIYPPYKFKVIDSLITNFHLPESSLLLLVAALMGREKMFKAYHHAIKNQYRFYSYGDAMLIL